MTASFFIGFPPSIIVDAKRCVGPSSIRTAVCHLHASLDSLGMVFFALSPRFETRMTEIAIGLAKYENGDINTEQGYRLDYWYRSIMAIPQKPIIGYGVGSWNRKYYEKGGRACL